MWAQALWGRGFLDAYAGRYESALTGLQQAHEMAEAVGDQSVLVRSLMAIGLSILRCFISVEPEFWASWLRWMAVKEWN